MKTGLFIGTNPVGVRNLCKLIFQNDQLDTLYVKLLTNSVLEQIILNRSHNVTINKDSFRKKVISFYRELRNVNLDVRVLLSNFRNPSLLQVITNNPIEIVYFDSSYSSSAVNTFVANCITNKSADCRTVPFSVAGDDDDDFQCFSSENEVDSYPTFENVVLGGTFDKLHVGHKVLLSEAIMKCRKRIVVAVTAESMLHSKILPEFIDDLATRIKLVSLFLNDVDPNLEYEILPLYDLYGPTKTDSSFQLIVISPDTLRGAEKINEYRESIGLNKLIVHSIDLIETSKVSDNEEDKVSSSNIRMRMLGELLKPPKPRPNLPTRPYIIGLSGGIGSGKSSVAHYLQSFGCGYINCDKLAHKMYEEGSAGCTFIKETFGFGVLNEDGSVNRKALATIVFSDREQLDKLNNGIWPCTLEAVRREISTTDNEVVVIEAALLIQANWVEDCHEVWSCIIPPHEAIKRLQNRNNLSIEEAQQRINSQPKNKEYVVHSNVVFCTLWDPSYTQKQVEKAWYLLRKRLPTTS